MDLALSLMTETQQSSGQRSYKLHTTYSAEDVLSICVPRYVTGAVYVEFHGATEGRFLWQQIHQMATLRGFQVSLALRQDAKT